MKKKYQKPQIGRVTMRTGNPLLSMSDPDASKTVSRDNIELGARDNDFDDDDF